MQGRLACTQLVRQDTTLIADAGSPEPVPPNPATADTSPAADALPSHADDASDAAAPAIQPEVVLERLLSQADQRPAGGAQPGVQQLGPEAPQPTGAVVGSELPEGAETGPSRPLSSQAASRPGSAASQPAAQPATSPDRSAPQQQLGEPALLLPPEHPPVNPPATLAAATPGAGTAGAFTRGGPLPVQGRADAVVQTVIRGPVHPISLPLDMDAVRWDLLPDPHPHRCADTPCVHPSPPPDLNAVWVSHVPAPRHAADVLAR